MQVWSVGLTQKCGKIPLFKQFPDSSFRYFNNGLELITALREHTAGRLAIFLNLHLPVLDGLGVIRLLQQEGLIDRHQFILSAPALHHDDRRQLEAWQVQLV